MSADQPVITVFGSHVPRPQSKDYELARKLGFLLAKAGYTVATGGYGGTMSAASQGASEAGGLVVGVSSAQVEATRNVTLNRWVNVHIQFETLEERVGYLVKSNDGMVVLPGGIGTLSEFALAWSYMQVGEIGRRPLVLLGAVWSETLGAFVKTEYVDPRYLELFYLAKSPEDAVTHVRNFRLS